MKWIIGFTTLILLVGTIAGVLIAGLNPWQNPAEVERLRVTNAHQAALNNLQEQLEKAKTEAEIASIQRQQLEEQTRFEAEMKYAEQLYDGKLAAYNSWIAVRNILLIVIGIALSLGFLIFIAVKSALMLRLAHPTSHPTHAQLIPAASRRRANPTYEQKRVNARQKELLNRAIMMRSQQAVYHPETMSGEQRNNLPLAV